MVNDKCWGIVRQYKNQENAERMCKFTDGSVLANTKTSTENKALLNFVSSAGLSVVWFGLRCWADELKECNWDDWDQVKYTNFKDGPKDGVFAFDSEDGKWYSKQDNVQLPFVCELRPTTKDCGTNCGVSFNNYCYKIYDLQKSFDDAENYCKQRNSHLVSTHDGLEARFVAQMYQKQGKYWIGGHMNHTDYSWVDGSPNDFSPPMHYQNGSCMKLEVDDDGNDLDWYGRSCDELSIFMCKRPVKPC
ncbi:hypothetical protein B9Z55_005074 [Caenorhabditis nigoni]|nr:hypothetical protein B9Z55_005074 [Caenorhabditis nigoni]